jgi:CheY-like chemotaxis protein/nitrogen-specific signal transduction histidine kinase
MFSHSSFPCLPTARAFLLRLVEWAARRLRPSQVQEAVREADPHKHEFIAILAHELRNPLAPVRTAVEIVLRIDGLQPAQRRACEVIERQVAHMARLIDDMLDVSRIASDKMPLRRERCDLAAIVRQTAADYSDTLEATGLKLVIEASPDPIWVDGDPVRLAQMMAHLLSNAMRFTDRGGQVCLRLEGDAAARTARVSVIDTGIGIAPELLPKLFDPFGQAHQDLARSKGGLGLGLALTRGLAQMHGGTAEVRSDGLGHGATFTLTLPIRASQSEGRAPAAPTNEASDALRILVIEDNVDAAQSLADLLTLLGHQVRVAFDGERGVQAAQNERPDVVISDIGLPGAIDGYGVAARLRAFPEFSGVRLIALSGYVDTQSRERARQAGFDAHIAKPADLPVLEAALRPP